MKTVTVLGRVGSEIPPDYLHDGLVLLGTGTGDIIEINRCGTAVGIEVGGVFIEIDEILVGPGIFVDISKVDGLPP